jgi:ABC-2 type transport system ATP-binding protein
VLGLDPRTDGIAIRRRVGYLAGDFTVDGRSTGTELLTYLSHLRGGVAPVRIDELVQRLGLDPSRRIKDLSKGNRQKVGVIQAFMHAPELLILDEPTSGLDPLLQHEFIAMVAEAKANGQTVFMSSHVLDEVQQTADRVGIVRDGVLIATEAVENLRTRAVRTVEIVFDRPVSTDEFAVLDGVSDITVDGARLRCRLDGRADPLVKAAARHTVVSFLAQEPDLEQRFFHYYSASEASHA